MTGGGPQTERATLIEGRADGRALALVMRALDGSEIEQVEFKPPR